MPFNASCKNTLFTNPIIFIAIFVFVITIFVAPISSNAANKMKVVQGPSIGIVGIEDIPSTTSVLPAISVPQCQSQAEIDRYGRGSYEANFSKMAICLNGQMSATVLNTQISALQASIDAIDDRLLRLSETVKYLQAFSKSNLNNLSLTFIPAGENSQKTNKLANGITAQCLVNSGETKGGVSGVGMSGNFNSSFFDPAPQSALRELKRFIEDYRRLKDKDKNKITLNEQAEIMRSIQKSTFATFIPVVKKYQNEGNYTSVGVSWISDKKGRRDTMSWASRKLVSPYIKDLPDELTYVNFSAGASVDGVIDGIINKDGFSHTFEKTYVSEPEVFPQLQESIAKHIKSYNDLKSSLQNQKTSLKAQLDTIIVNKYYCS